MRENSGFGSRAISDYSIAPVNPNNAVILCCLISDLLLALFYLRYARAVSLGYQQKHIKWLAPIAVLVSAFILGFKLPLLFLSSQFSIQNIIFILSDALAAVAAFVLTDKNLREGIPISEKQEDC